MIHENMKSQNEQAVCPECKNNIDLGRYPQINTGMIIECNHCGMTLLVKGNNGGKIETEIVDEGK